MDDSIASGWERISGLAFVFGCIFAVIVLRILVTGVKGKPLSCNKEFKNRIKASIYKNLTLLNVVYSIHIICNLLIAPIQGFDEFAYATSIMVTFAFIGTGFTLKYSQCYKLFIHLASFQSFMYTVMCTSTMSKLAIYNVVAFMVQFITMYYYWLPQQTTLRIKNTSHHITLLCGTMFLNILMVPFYAHIYVKYEKISYFMFGLIHSLSILTACIHCHCITYTNNAYYQWLIIDSFQNKDVILKRLYCCLHNYCHSSIAINRDIYINMETNTSKLFYKHHENTGICLAHQSLYLYTKNDEDKIAILNNLYQYILPYNSWFGCGFVFYFIKNWMRDCLFKGMNFINKYMGYTFYIFFIIFLLMDIISLFTAPIVFVMHFSEWISLWYLYVPFFLVYGFVMKQIAYSLYYVIYYDIYFYEYISEIACSWLKNYDVIFEVQLERNKVVWDILGDDIGNIVLMHMRDGDYLTSLITKDFKSIKINTNIFVSVLHLAEQYKSDELLNHLLTFAKKNKDQLNNCTQFRQLPFFVQSLLTKI